MSVLALVEGKNLVKYVLRQGVEPSHAETVPPRAHIKLAVPGLLVSRVRGTLPVLCPCREFAKIQPATCSRETRSGGSQSLPKHVQLPPEDCAVVATCA